jgi:hypothetical protein
MDSINETVSTSQALHTLQRNASANDSLFNVTAPEPVPLKSTDVAEEIKQFNLTTDAVNLILADVGCPSELRALIDALIGVAGRRLDNWFEATDRIIAERLEMSTKTVQRYRDELITWQESNGISFVEIKDNFTDDTGKRRGHFYKVHISRQAIETLQEAKVSKEWSNPGSAFKEIIKRRRDNLPDAPPRPSRRKRVLDTESIIQKNLKTVNTLLLDTLRRLEKVEPGRLARGNDSPFNLSQDVLGTIKSILEKLSNSPYGSDDDNEHVQHPIQKVMDTEDLNTAAAEEAACVPSKVYGGQNVQVDTDDALRAVEAFESVGATTFDVTMIIEMARPKRDSYEKGLSANDLKDKLNEYLERTKGMRSFMVRPRGAALIQVDDLTASMVESLKPFAFLVAETSKENFQAWLALPDGTDNETVKQTRSRLLLSVKADKGASGSMRWPGSINRKASRNAYRVRLVNVEKGLTVTEHELEAAGLLAPKPKEMRLTAPVSPANSRREFPSYEKCLASKNGNHSDADASFIWIATDRGFTADEAWAELERVAARPKLRRSDYRAKTLRYASH